MLYERSVDNLISFFKMPVQVTISDIWQGPYELTTM